MIFTRNYTQTCTIKKKEIYPFDISKEEKEEGMKRDWQNPFLIFKEGSVTGLYKEKNKLRLRYYHSYDEFTEGFGEHGEHQKGKDWVRCKCGELFRASKTITAQERLDKHLEHIKKLKGDYKDE